MVVRLSSQHSDFSLLKSKPRHPSLARHACLQLTTVRASDLSLASLAREKIFLTNSLRQSADKDDASVRFRVPRLSDNTHEQKKLFNSPGDFH